MSLHWYCPEHGLTFLRHGKLALSSLSQLHDPLLQNKKVKPLDLGAPITDVELGIELQRQYQALPNHLRAMVAEDYFKQQALAKREDIVGQIKQRKTPSAAYLSAGQVEAIALLDLYSSSHSLQLWDQKADNHKGMMFSFKNSIPDFKTPKYKDKPQRFGQVKYTSTRPLSQPGAPLEPLFTRPICFQHEKACRLVRFKSAADKHLLLNGVDWYLYKLPFSQIEALTFGCQMNEAEIEKIVSIMQTDLRYRHIKLNRCLLDPLTYDLIIEPID